jgi:hypothetical protein
MRIQFKIILQRIHGKVRKVSYSFIYKVLNEICVSFGNVPKGPKYIVTREQRYLYHSFPSDDNSTNLLIYWWKCLLSGFLKSSLSRILFHWNPLQISHTCMFVHACSLKGSTTTYYTSFQFAQEWRLMQNQFWIVESFNESNMKSLIYCCEGIFLQE